MKTDAVKTPAKSPAILWSPMLKTEPGVEERVTDEDRTTMPTEQTSTEFLTMCHQVGVSPPSGEAVAPDWEHLGG